MRRDVDVAVREVRGRRHGREQLGVLAVARPARCAARLAVRATPTAPGRTRAASSKRFWPSQRDEAVGVLLAEQVGEDALRVVVVVDEQHQVAEADERVRAVPGARQRVRAAMDVAHHMDPHGLDPATRTRIADGERPGRSSPSRSTPGRATRGPGRGRPARPEAPSGRTAVPTWKAVTPAAASTATCLRRSPPPAMIIAGRVRVPGGAADEDVDPARPRPAGARPSGRCRARRRDRATASHAGRGRRRGPPRGGRSRAAGRRRRASLPVAAVSIVAGGVEETEHEPVRARVREARGRAPQPVELERGGAEAGLGPQHHPERQGRGLPDGLRRRRDRGSGRRRPCRRPPPAGRRRRPPPPARRRRSARSLPAAALAFPRNRVRVRPDQA